jgi:hypothetical protein
MQPSGEVGRFEVVDFPSPPADRYRYRTRSLSCRHLNSHQQRTTLAESQMPTAERIDPGFTTADAEYPSMSFDGRELQLRFADWREQPVLITFRDVSRFEWSDEPDDYFDGEPYDGTSVVRNSGWIPRIAADGSQHLRLNFNACGGRLDVACLSFDVADEEGR